MDKMLSITMVNPIKIILFASITNLLETVCDILLMCLVGISVMLYSLYSLIALIYVTFEDGIRLILTNKRKYYKLYNGQLYSQQELIVRVTYIAIHNTIIEQSVERFKEAIEPFKQAVPVYY